MAHVTEEMDFKFCLPFINLNLKVSSARMWLVATILDSIALDTN